MNIIDQNVLLDPNTTKLIHCKSCDATFADNRIPNVCPHCGANRKKLAQAKDDECESFLVAYSEIVTANAEANDTSFPDSFIETAGPYSQMSSSNDETAFEEDPYDPIGYDPDEFLNNMAPKRKISKLEKSTLLSAADTCIREKKWVLQRLGLPTAGLQAIVQDIRQNAESLGINIPGYTDMALKTYVDHTLQQELRHPQKGRAYSYASLSEVLQELDISESYWNSYFAIAGLDPAADPDRMSMIVR